MREQKLRDNKALKGRTWEIFVREWLLASQRYTNVWLLQDVPEEVLRKCSIERLDSGIDIVAELAQAENALFYNPKTYSTAPHTKYVAIQCKFRSPDKLGRTKRLPWSSVSTTVGLCSLTGPWARCLICTNAPGMGRKTVPVSGRFVTLAYRTFDKTDRDTWLRICGIYMPRRLDRADSPISSAETIEKEMATRVPGPAVIHTLAEPSKPKPRAKRKPKKIPEGRMLQGWDIEKPKTKEELREAMLKRFDTE